MFFNKHTYPARIFISYWYLKLLSFKWLAHSLYQFMAILWHLLAKNHFLSKIQFEMVFAESKDELVQC